MKVFSFVKYDNDRKSINPKPNPKSFVDIFVSVATNRLG